MLPLHEFLSITAACVELPDKKLFTSGVQWGSTNIYNINDAHNYLNAQYEKERKIEKNESSPYYSLATGKRMSKFHAGGDITSITPKVFHKQPGMSQIMKESIENIQRSTSPSLLDRNNLPIFSFGV